MVGVGAILSPLLIAILIGTLSVVGTWASKVPELRTIVELQFGHMNKTVKRLTEAQIATNDVLKAHAISDTKLITIISETLVGHDFMIKQVIKDQELIKHDLGKK